MYKKLEVRSGQKLLKIIGTFTMTLDSLQLRSLLIVK